MLINTENHYPLFSFDLTYKMMRSFISHTEESIKSSIDTFKEKGPEEYEIEVCSEENIYQYVKTYMGLDDQDDVFLEDIFTSYFPSIQRRSAFLTVFGFYEYEIEKFCSHFASKNQTNITLSDIKNNGLERSHIFIKKIIGVNDTAAFSELKKIIKLRNSCAHNDARITLKDGQDIKEIVTLLREQSTLLERDGDHILFNTGFIEYVLECFNRYIIEIKKQVSNK
jgi:hypothetical protein